MCQYRLPEGDMLLNRKGMRIKDSKKALVNATAILQRKNNKMQNKNISQIMCMIKNRLSTEKQKLKQKSCKIILATMSTKSDIFL